MTRLAPAVEIGSRERSGGGWTSHLQVRETLPTYRSVTTEAEPLAGIQPSSGPAASTTPDPFGDLDSLLELEDEIRSLSVQIHAATHRLLVLIAEFDRRRGWEVGGHRSCADWLSFRTGIDRGAARERVRAARALEELPETSAAMSRGELSFSQIRALTRVATAANEDELLEFARENSASRAAAARRRADALGLLAERALAAGFTAEKGAPVSGTRPERYQVVLHVEEETLRSAEVAQGWTGGLRRTSGRPRVPAETGSVKSVHHRMDVSTCTSPETSSGNAARRKGTVEPGGVPGRAEMGNTEGKARAENDSTVNRRGTDREDIAATATAPTPRSHLEDGTRVSAETSRRLCCDAAIVRVREAPDGSVLDVGRKTRTVPPALRRALDIRDRGCRFPGCESRFTDAHHVVHWADGGETSLTNCLLLCRHHHRLVHEGGWRIHWLGKAMPLFVDRRGQQHFDGGWKPPASTPVDASPLGCGGP